MFRRFSPPDMIIHTRVSEDAVKSNGLPLGSRVGGVLCLKDRGMIRFEKR